MKKRLILLLFLWCAQLVISPAVCAHSTLDELSAQMDNEEPILDLDDNDILSDDEDLLAILGEPMEKPSALWTWFCTMGSKLAAHCIHAQRYMEKLLNRFSSWFKQRSLVRKND